MSCKTKGKISGDTIPPREVAPHSTAATISSLVESNNELSIAMLYRIGTFRVYKKPCAAISR